jgi:DNA helicase-2/ATP-dependent DNA helicase PcrA
VLDYDDLLAYWSQMLTEPALAAELGRRFAHVLVDEYQDTNRLQATILRALKPDGRGLTVVGDDAQSIYSFRGATVRNIVDFPAQFEPRARIVTLERNYRSTRPILSASNAVIRHAAERFTKDLWTERVAGERPALVTVRDEAEQARYVAERVLARREAGIELRQQAVLFRASDHSALLELELARRDIPFVKFGGLKFLEAAHVKDVIALLRWASNPRDRVSAFRVLQILPGVGPRIAARTIDAVLAAVDAAAALAAQPVAAAVAADRDALAALYARLRGGGGGWPAELDAVRRWYEPHLTRMHDHAPARLADLRQLAAVAAGVPTRERFLTELTLDPPEATSAEAGAPLLDEEYLILSTIHSAKGQEWRAVVVLNAVDGCIPSDMATGSAEEIEEERRLLYVAMTRARDHLTLVVPQRFHVTGQSAGGDRHVYASRTRFVPKSILAEFDVSGWPVVCTAERGVAPPAAGPPRIDIAARMRGMWS